jgi:Uma2 family endonuclease
MSTVVIGDDSVHIPGWVVDLDSFRRWVQSDEVPEKLRVCFLDGEVWVDMSKEQAFTHNQVKNEFNITLGGLVKAGRLGRYFPDGMLVTNRDANLSAGPDAVFVSHGSLREGKVRLVEGRQGGVVELEGTPDMVLEIVSDSSVKKDTVTLRDLYWKAGIPEYWLVDARGDEPEFTVLRRGARDYASVRKQGGWLKSAVFGKSFRLTRQGAEDGNPEYTLEVR